MTWKHFSKDEAGAVTVDWVVLTAALIGMGLLFLTPVALSTTSAVNTVSGVIANTQTGYANN